jgi:hypothetical protein
MLTWHFKAPMVHDFAWGADPDFMSDIYKELTTLIYITSIKDNVAIKDNWKNYNQPQTKC